MGTKCKWNNQFQQFYGTPMFLSTGALSTNFDADSATEEVIFSTTIYGDTFNSTDMHFRVTIGGTISSDGSDDTAVTLRYGTTDILALTTVSLPNEDDYAVIIEFFGRIHTTGSSGKVVAQGRLMNSMTGMADILGTTAAAGVTVDLTADGSINVTSDWDTTSADTDIVVTSATLELFN